MRRPALAAMTTRRRTRSSNPAGFRLLAPFSASASAAAFSAASRPAHRTASTSASIRSSAPASGRGAARASRADRREAVSSRGRRRRALPMLSRSRVAPFGLLSERGPATRLSSPGQTIAVLGEGRFDLTDAERKRDRLRSPALRLEPIKGPADPFEDDTEGDPLVFPGRDRRLVLRRQEEAPPPRRSRKSRAISW